MFCVTIVLAAFSLIFLIVTASLYPMWLYFDAAHPLVGGIEGAVAIERDGEGEPVVVEDTTGDVAGYDKPETRRTIASS